MNAQNNWQSVWLGARKCGDQSYALDCSVKQRPGGRRRQLRRVGAANEVEERGGRRRGHAAAAAHQGLQERFELKPTTGRHKLQLVIATADSYAFRRQLWQQRCLGQYILGLVAVTELLKQAGKIAVSARDCEAWARAVISKARIFGDADFDDEC